MARCVLAAGFHLQAFDHSSGVIREIVAAGIRSASNESCATMGDVVISLLPNSEVRGVEPRSVV
jgi:3-hydroxyisobutyrate dehydrogenase-like beta-hydroxyacid dehydrogenase